MTRSYTCIQTQTNDILIDAISTDAEKKYTSSKLECACIIWAIKRWKHYLYAVPKTTILTDNKGKKGNEYEKNS